MARKQDPSFFVDITRVDDEQRMVYGYATTEALDSKDTIIDLGSVAACLPDYLVWRNVREMHQPSAVGTAEDVTLDDKGLYIGAKIVDDQAWVKVKGGVYKGFSIGAKKDYQVGNRIFIKKISEISLGDRPANEECTFDTFRIYNDKKEGSMKETEERVVTADVVRYAGEEISDVSTALRALEAIMWLKGYEQSEAAGDAHPEAAEQVAQLTAAIEALKKFIVSEIKEDSAGATSTEQAIIPLVELTDGDPDVTRADAEPDIAPTETPDITRSGAAISSANLTRIQSMHDHCAALGAACTKTEECARVAVDNAAVDAEDDVQRLETLEADVTRLSTENETLRAEVDRLKAEPAPAKGVTRVVSKEDDDPAATTETRIEETTDPKEAIKRIHQAGGVTITRL